MAFFWQVGDTRTLKSDNFEVIGQGRPCGTPGCCLPDWHSGPHSLRGLLAGQRGSTRSLFDAHHGSSASHFRGTRLTWTCKRWSCCNSGDACETLAHFARLARAIRPMRVVILRALQLNVEVDGLLSSSFTASDRKLRTEPSPLMGLFWGIFSAGDPSNQVDEQMRVELRLLRPKSSPRSWKCMLQLHMWTTASNCDCIRLASVQVFYNPSERIGQLRSGARKRRHTFCEQRDSVYAERNEAIQQYGICICATWIRSSTRSSLPPPRMSCYLRTQSL